ncbi:methylated-DNA--[protein]-cysteine S-methyltransferase [Staphylococcus lloydii]|uniref:methylated-DNA--[protein]-cysteine S-methyltransferase n=1 Tax=Staphylococcus lloydii TaxID=2781774 RepID=UPI00292A3A80|nr:methylated-DNA--[protein]-cysteine S-methyltransferase [Staphylococcus lloydii]MDU9418442.1 methylated-DNA--[protein]-cysteine S-methyltransferase [Staphylococcus lloydii]
MQFKRSYKSPVGNLTITTDGENITGLWFENQQNYETLLNDTVKEQYQPIFDKVTHWLDEYFSGNKPTVNFSLKPTGTDFRMNVWSKLREIPYGETVTYGDIAQQIATERGQSNMSAQAVGGAVGSNPISIIIPCHRVVGANGSLTGFGSGIDRKIKLLNNEKVDMSSFYVPSYSTKP